MPRLTFMDMTRAMSAFTLVVAIALAAPTALAGNGNGKAKGHGKAAGQNAAANQDGARDQGDRLEDEIVDEVLDGIFGEDERTVIQRYSRTHGLTGTSLPPGIAKNVARGKPLPPGIAKRGLPRDLDAKLPTLREGLERVIVGDDVTIVETGTRIVVDVLEDVLRGG